MRTLAITALSLSALTVLFTSFISVVPENLWIVETTCVAAIAVFITSLVSLVYLAFSERVASCEQAMKQDVKDQCLMVVAILLSAITGAFVRQAWLHTESYFVRGGLVAVAILLTILIMNRIDSRASRN